METTAVSSLSYQPDRPAAAEQSLGQRDFLKLMITQFQNQDPFQPLESGEFLGQIAQFSTVAGISELQTAFGDLSKQLVGNQALQGAGLIGRDALVAVDSVDYDGQGESLRGVVEVAGDGDVVVELSDAAGQLVRSISLGQPGPGQTSFSWDGRNGDGSEVPAGEYQITARINSETGSTSVPVLLQGRIASISLGGSAGAAFNVVGIGAVALSEIRQVQEP